MGKFQFQKNEVPLDINGNQFSLPATTEYALKIQEMGERAQKYADSIRSLDNHNVVVLSDTVRFVRDCIDEILGCGAAEKIFYGRDENLYDCIDVFAYICEEFSAFQKTKNQGYGKYSPSRAARK